MKNKRGWIRIVEAFVAILLLAGVFLVLVNQGYIGKKDISQKVYDIELSILRGIELNDEFRAEILGLEDEDLPVGLNDTLFPPNVKDRINKRLPNYLNCEAQICDLDKACEVDEDLYEDLYVQSVGITANLTIYNPRQVKLFCWVV